VLERLELVVGRIPHAPGARRDRARDRHERRHVAVLHEVVLGDPDQVVAEAIHALGLVEHARVQLGVRTTAARRIAEVVGDAEAHHASRQR
jgi:hypothetical protein